MSLQPMNRRSFLKSTTGAAIGAFATPFILSSSRVFGANGRVILGLMGCGGRGNFLADFLAQRDDCEIAYISDADSRRMPGVSQTIANAGAH